MIRNVHIELTSNCNLKCKMCLAQKNKDILSFEQFLKIIEQLKRFNDEGKTDIVNVEIAGHGEPLLYKDIIKVSIIFLLISILKKLMRKDISR